MKPPRIRSIKPEVHHDEQLWDLEQSSGMPLFRLFTGLWAYADRQGRFEWRPRVLKAGILPWWDGDVAAALELLTPKFIVKYEVDGRPYGWVRTFERHQAINGREAESVIPPPPSWALAANENGQPPPQAGPLPPLVSAAITRAARVPHASTTRPVHARVEGNGTEGDLDHGTEQTRRDASAGGGSSAGRGSHPPPTPWFDSSDVIRAFSELRRAAGGGAYQSKRSDYDRAQAAVEWALAEAPDQPLQACRQSIANFLRFARGKDQDGWPFWAWANDPGRWFTTTAVAGPLGRVGTRDEFERDAGANPDWAGPTPTSPTSPGADA